jgi:acylglycerol lipase
MTGSSHLKEVQMPTEAHFSTRDELKFVARHWLPVAAPRADLVLLHGYGDHCGRYDHVAKALNAIGLAVYSYDQRGHGRSPGKRGYVRDFNELLSDLDAYLEYLRPSLDGRPLFLMGHSMGGMVLARYVQTRRPDVRGLVFSSPFLAIKDDVSPVLIALARILSTLTPWLPVAKVDSADLSRDPEVARASDADPLSYHGRLVARTGAEFNTAIALARADFNTITAPVYILHGTDDRLVPCQGSRLLYEGCGSADKTLTLYEGGYHELVNDLEKDKVIAGLCAWLDKRC